MFYSFPSAPFSGLPSPPAKLLTSVWLSSIASPPSVFALSLSSPLSSPLLVSRLSLATSFIVIVRLSTLLDQSDAGLLQSTICSLLLLLLLLCSAGDFSQLHSSRSLLSFTFFTFTLNTATNNLHIFISFFPSCFLKRQFTQLIVRYQEERQSW